MILIGAAKINFAYGATLTLSSSGKIFQIQRNRKNGENYGRTFNVIRIGKSSGQ